ncbi:TetR family transcriptional regulator [Salipaludibacillus neizhouensis]|uniref:TetR family transcriptional regulator n=1 Tax=Salipaludibacillus neizhouensis TaxID=885475 RepID=A0A3A9K1M1_9BACI|nr:TetR/AcrR family transcriptional regulator [Salipaludibacillus neizhouensis]RKL64790.1 TetR family transcriptional regulator [Salipaludibacillus neizhouensis]
MNLKTYQETKLQHTENLKQTIVEAAAMLLQEQGPDAVTIRRVAEKMECSTKIIYNLFNKKDGLIKLLYLEGCKLLAKSFQSVKRQENMEDYLRALCEAYWEFSYNYPNYYQLMFGGAFSEFKPEEESIYATTTALQQFTQVITEAIEAGLIAEKDPQEVVCVIWASLHGLIHLYLGGHIESLETAKALYNKSVTKLIRTYMQSSTW